MFMALIFFLYFFAKNTSLNNTITKKLGEDFSELVESNLREKGVSKMNREIFDMWN